ncbi:MAG: sensor histidine kinase [Chloroflexota bacterium]
MTAHNQQKTNATLRFILGIALIVASALGIFYLLMKPPMSDLGAMAQFLSATAIISAGAGYLAYRYGWIERSPTLRWSLLGSYVLASALTFVNVWVTARLMFASQHDLMLATVLLLFAGGIATVLGFFLASTLTERIGDLDRAARQIEGGDLGARVPVRGADELAALSETFNAMAARLEAAEARQKELDALRRDLVAWAGHDLQTPLASVRAIVEALADGMVDDDETRQRYLRTAQRDIQNLSDLINDLFEMSQIDAGGLKLDLSPASLSDLLSDTLESFSALAVQQGVKLEVSLEPGVDPVVMDVQRIARVLNNLVGNALRHTPEGGTVSVLAGQANGRVTVSVSDTGEGIPAADIPKIFERFYRGEKSRNRSTGGAGLGLAIARGIVEAHGGEIGVESKLGRGTRFFFHLPKA